MSHLAKVVAGCFAVGVILGLVILGMMLGLETVFVDADGNFRRGRARGGSLIVPVLLGAAAGWCAMKGFERISGMSGSILVFVLSLVGGGAAFGTAVLFAGGSLERMSDNQAMIIAGLSAGVFIITTTGMAFMDE